MTPEDKEILIASLTKEKDGKTIVPKVPDHAIRLLEETCSRTGLDWRLRHCYLIERGGKWRVELSIDGFRAIAGAQADYDGQDGPYYTMAPDGQWTDVPPDKEPYAAKVGIRRKGQSSPTYATAKFKDYQTGAMWKKFPSTMTAKCAEMLALRKAFPNVLGGLYGAEEMSQAGGGEKRAGRTPTPASPGSEVTVDPTTEDNYEQRIADCTTLEAHAALGKEITATNLDLPRKKALNALWKVKKSALCPSE